MEPDSAGQDGHKSVVMLDLSGVQKCRHAVDPARYWEPDMIQGKGFAVMVVFPLRRASVGHIERAVVPGAVAGRLEDWC